MSPHYRILPLAAALALGPSASPPPSAAPGHLAIAFSSGASLRREAIPGPLPAIVTRIIDGDTFEARIRIWFGAEITTLVRLRGYDAPELKARCAVEAEEAAMAAEALADFLTTGPVQIADVTLDKYGGRVVARVLVADSALPGAAEDVAALMLASAPSRPYAGGRRGGWCGVGLENGMSKAARAGANP